MNDRKAIYLDDAIDALDCINGVEEVLRALPSAQPEQEPGEWKPYTYVDPDDWYQDKEIRYRCSKCGVEVIDKSNFCPNCGADMRVAERREE